MVDASFWNGHGGAKWVANQALMDRILAPYAAAIFEAAQLPEVGTVVDVGCGCGATTLMAARERPGLTVIGVDVSGPMLAHARHRADQEGLAIALVHGDAATTVPAQAVDRIVSRFGVMFFDDPPQAFANLRRWLAPGGRLVATVWGRVADNQWMTDLLGLLRRHLPVDEPTEDGCGPFGMSDPERVAALLHGAGLVDVQQRWIDEPMRIPGCIDDVVSYFADRTQVQLAFASASPQVREAVMHEIRAYVQERHDGHGVGLGARARLVSARAP